MTPSTGAWSARSTSSSVFTLVSRYSMKNARPMPAMRPMTIPPTMFKVLLGLTGAMPSSAGSMICTVLLRGIVLVNFLLGDPALERVADVLLLVQVRAWPRSTAGSCAACRCPTFLARFHFAAVNALELSFDRVHANLERDHDGINTIIQLGADGGQQGGGTLHIRVLFAVVLDQAWQAVVQPG